MSQRKRPELVFTVGKIKQTFQNNSDVVIQTFAFKNRKTTFIFCEGMIDQRIINEVIYGRVEAFASEHRRQKLTGEVIESALYVPDLKRLTTIRQMIAETFIGK